MKVDIPFKEQVHYISEVNMSKLTPKVILEGTRLTFKTEIAFELQRTSPLYRTAQIPLPFALDFWRMVHLHQLSLGSRFDQFCAEEETQAMETYQTWVRLLNLNRYYSWVVDRFHISTQMVQLLTNGKRYDFTWLEERLLPLNFRLIFCTRSPESFADCPRERLKVSGNPRQYDDLELFKREQEVLEELVSRLFCLVLHVDISDNDVPKAVETIVDWMAETGGLEMPSR